MPVSRTMWLKGLHEDYAKIKANIRDEYNDKTKAVTLRWREGFAALKLENDTLQKENKDWLNAQLKDAGGDFAQELAQGPPKD